MHYAIPPSVLQAVSAYHFEQHARSTKKHPADYIYLGNGNSLRDVLRASERSPLEALEKTIRSSIDPVAKRTCVNCLNCNGKNFMLDHFFKCKFSMIQLTNLLILQSMFFRHHKLNMYSVNVALSQSNLKILLLHHIHVIRAIPGKQFEQIICYILSCAPLTMVLSLVRCYFWFFYLGHSFAEFLL